MPKVTLHGRMTRVRILALFLLGTLAWGATAEVTHRHNGQLTARTRQSLTAIVSNTPAPSDTKTVSPETQTVKAPFSAQCPLCQLQQNLSATLFGSTLRFAAADALWVRLAAQRISTLSNSTLIHDGRAPPLNSLS